MNISSSTLPRMLFAGDQQTENLLRSTLADAFITHGELTDSLHQALVQTGAELLLLDASHDPAAAFALCAALRAKPNLAQLLVLMLVARDDLNSEAAAFAAGANDCLCLPAHPDVVHARIEGLLRRRPLLRDDIDPLTGLLSRNGIHRALRAEWQRCLRSQTPLSLLLLDLDDFAQFSARHGSAIADRCLITIASQLRGGLHRPGDLWSRYEADRFLALMPETGYHGAVQKAEEIGEALADLPAIAPDLPTDFALTASRGVASITPSSSATLLSLLQTSETMLALAKQDGKNCTYAQVV